jgi:uncharacterized membrane protein YdbT with pleckstrin-like domain
MNIEKIQFETDERILIQVRKHWFILAVQILGIVGAALMPLVLYLFIMNTDVPGMKAFAINTSLVFTLYSAWLLLVWMSLFSVWNNYYLDVWTITNKRLIAVDQRGFFSRTTASFRLDRMQDTEISVQGIIATLLDYGSLEIQTAGEDSNFKVYGLPNPGDLKALILSAADGTLSAPDETQK